ncbi:hypothetical protein GIY56_04525 [Paracoccus sp. YIM 132242]|uniref:RiboL-PSP-HEPN domain-containing protein n=1 Tax=Paracoccus lichenicola TaxID=2665644 RepID=A0A6L6HM35_9RHOB|nr:hypothetical protein [Paracoccus lichenicola]MTD99548.1 hypothetical protein [Paracoccus lichenicola]
MSGKLGFSEEFTEAEYASIGRLVRAFTELEHVLASTVISLSGGGDAAETDLDLEKKFKDVVSGTMERRLEVFLKFYREKYGENVEVNSFEDTARALLEWRNAVFHGRWLRADTGLMQNIFYQRNYVRNKKDPPAPNLSIKDLNSLKQQTLSCVKSLRDLTADLK